MVSRREMLSRTFGSSLSLGLLAMLGEQNARAAAVTQPAYLTHPPKAKRVIMIFLDGGLSHVDSFDYKPALVANHDKRVANNVFTGMGQKMSGNEGVYLKKPVWNFSPGGQSGMMVSDLFPRLRTQVDELCMINSLHTGHANHFEAVIGMHTGSFNSLRPSIGSWCNYALGSECKNLPGFVSLAKNLPYGGNAAFSSDFLPGEFHGVRIRPGAEPVKYLKPQRSAKAIDAQLDLVRDLNVLDQQKHELYGALNARMHAWETAAGMQLAAPEALDISKEPEVVREAYGTNRPGEAGEIAWKCLVARRLAERGVRFVEIVQTGWDAHGDLKNAHEKKATAIDQPLSAMLADLKQRGMLEDTLVVFTTEFGRTPANSAPNKDGRDHHPHAFSSWLAGGGVKSGFTYGRTDEHGIHIAENGMHVHDFHATILHLLGIDHLKLTFRNAGRDYRLTDVEGEIVHGILA